MTKRPHTRRLFLKSMGISIALPYFESLMGALPKVNAQEIPQKKNFIACFFPNGTYAMVDTPLGRDNGVWRYGNGGVLQPFQDAGLGQNLMVVRGMSLRGGIDQHLYGTAAILSGTVPTLGRNSSGFNLRCGESIDQMIAKKIQSENPTQIPSLQLGYKYMGHPAFNSSAHQHYINCISWRTPTEPLLPVYSPQSVYDNLFRPTASEAIKQHLNARDKSILDFVMSQTEDIQSKLNPSDSARMDKYLTQLREMEKDLQSDATNCPDQPPRNDYVGSPTYMRHWQRMNRLAVLAIKCGLTRVATIMFNNGTGDPWANSHSIAHGSVERGGKNVQRHIDVNLTYLELFRDIMQQLIDDDLFEDTVMLMSSCMAMGLHGNKNIPTLVASAGGGLKLGQEINTFNRNIPLQSLEIDLLRMYGINLNQLGHEGEMGRPDQLGIFT